MKSKCQLWVSGKINRSRPWLWCYPIPSEGWGCGGIPRKSRSSCHLLPDFTYQWLDSTIKFVTQSQEKIAIAYSYAQSFAMLVRKTLKISEVALPIRLRWRPVESHYHVDGTGRWHSLNLQFLGLLIPFLTSGPDLGRWPNC